MPERTQARRVATSGYEGPGELTPGTALTSSTPDVPAIVLALAVAALYLTGVRAAGRWSSVRATAFVAGLVLALLATCSFVGVYAPVLFWVYVVQACLLLLVAPLLLGAGAPLTLAARSASWGAGARRLTASWLFRTARVPGFGPLVLIVVTTVLLFTPLMTASLRSDAVGELVRLGLLVAGLIVALPVTDEAMSLTSAAYAAALGLAFVEFLLDAVPGIALRLHSTVLQPQYWGSLHRPWGPSPLQDQQLAGAVLWFFGEAGDIPFIAALLAAWVRSDAREARAVDAALDAADLRRPVTDVVADEPERTRPWWETDPSVFGEARARRYGRRPEQHPDEPAE
jgi:putative membrane protein